MIFLDSNVLIDVVRGRRSVREAHHRAEQERVSLLLSARADHERLSRTIAAAGTLCRRRTTDIGG